MRRVPRRSVNVVEARLTSEPRIWRRLGIVLTICLLEDSAYCTASGVRPKVHALAAHMSVRHDHEQLAIGSSACLFVS